MRKFGKIKDNFKHLLPIMKIHIVVVDGFWKEFTSLGETFLGESDEFYNVTKVSPAKVSPDKIIKICPNNLFPS